MTDGTILEKSPHTILATSILARSFNERGDYKSTDIIVDAFEVLDKENIPIPPTARANIAWVKAEDQALRGTILEQNYDGLPSKHKSLFLSVGRPSMIKII